MKKIYIVTTGEYSDYQIVACFSSKEKAEKYSAVKNDSERWSPYYVEEYDVDSADVDDNIKVRYMYRAYFRKNRVPKRIEVDYCNTTTSEAESKMSCGCYNYTVEIVLDKKNKSKAQKIADDMLAKFKAENI